MIRVFLGDGGWAGRLWDGPSREANRAILFANAAVIAVTLTVGRPLGDLKRSPLGVVSVLQAACSAEVLCTIGSFLQLLACGAALWAVYRLRRAQTPGAGRWGPALLWLLMAAGFFYLAADEIAFLHEGIDKLVHLVLGIRETAWTDRLDDFIPAVYALIGLGVLWRYRNELAQFRGFWPRIAVGMAFMAVMVGLDALTNRKDVLTWLIADRETAVLWWNKLSALEEGCKLLAEAAFLAAFLRCREMARAMDSAEEPAVLPFPPAPERQDERRAA